MDTVLPKKRRGRPPKFGNVWGVNSPYNKIKQMKERTQDSTKTDKPTITQNQNDGPPAKRAKLSEEIYIEHCDSDVKNTSPKRDKTPMPILVNMNSETHLPDNEMNVAHERHMETVSLVNERLTPNLEKHCATRVSPELYPTKQYYSDNIILRNVPRELYSPNNHGPLHGRLNGEYLDQVPHEPKGYSSLYEHSGDNHTHVNLDTLDQVYENNPETYHYLRKFFEAGGRCYSDFIQWFRHTKATSMDLYRKEGSQVGYDVAGRRLIEDTDKCLDRSPQSRDRMPPLTHINGGNSHFPHQQNKPHPLQNMHYIPNDNQLNARTHNSYVQPAKTCNTAYMDIQNCGYLRDESITQQCEQLEVLDLSTKKTTMSDTNGVIVIRDSCQTPSSTGSESDSQSMMMMTPVMPNDAQQKDVRYWSVQEVHEFVSSIPECAGYSHMFVEHSIDGLTLLHLSEQHMLNFLQMKLGPSLHLTLAIKNLKDKLDASK